MFTDPQVVNVINEHFVPMSLHVHEQADEFKRLGARYKALWTPTLLTIDAQGEECHRLEGFLPVNDFLAQLILGLGHSAFARGDFSEAERWFREVVETYPATDSAPEALYWKGVARYKATGDPAALVDTAAQFRRRYQDTSWAKKASV